ncbi:MAG: PAC2 family protein [Ilumatobacteraceae bacterium]|jgi:proteasome assembly chaperone (PAC2) family protein
MARPTHVRWIGETPTLTSPVIVAAFTGWNDAADAASNAVTNLVEGWGARLLAEIDPEEFTDFATTRPRVRLREGGRRVIDWPAVRLWHVRGAGGDVVLMLGPEPSTRWKLFSRVVLAVAEKLGASMMLTLGALLADVPHSRPVQLIGTASDPEVIARHGLQRSRYEGPTGIVGVLQDAFHAASIPSASLWAAVPAYASQVPSPKATLALMRRACEIIGTPAPVASVMQLIDRYEEQVDSLVNDDDDLVAYVERLEHMTDEGMSIDDEVDEDQLPLQYAEPGRRDDGGGDGDGDDAGTLLAEVEQFLRDQSGG